MKELFEELNIYKKELKTYNVRDRHVVNLKINFVTIMFNLISTIPFVLINLVFVRILDSII